MDPSQPATETTRIEREHFLLHAPFEWKAVPCDQPLDVALDFEFHNQTLPEELIVSVMIAREPLSEDQLRRTVERLTEIRLESSARLSDGRAVASPVDY